MMKKIIGKIKRVFKDNVWLLIVMLIILSIIGIFGWKWSLRITNRKLGQNSLNTMIENEKEEKALHEEEPGNEYLRVVIRNDQAYLVNADNESVFEPCVYIYDELNSLNFSKVFRYIDNNGLVGFAKVEGEQVEVIYQGVFSEASKMLDGSACVKEGEEFYYIDTEGKRFSTGEYKRAFPFGESQGLYARVQKKDGSWCVIDCNENEYLTDFDYIYELPYVTTTGSGIKNGKVVLFSLDTFEDYQEPKIIKTFDEYSEIDAQYTNFALVTANNGNKGVICTWNGDVVVPADYINIEWGFCDFGDDEGEEQNWFRCQKKDGTYDVIYWKF